ncbi:MAG: tetratricopeptide repeat protein [Planctomycetes bacterium]|nr:tetratricopeptide repeat protein [Planctomycetota bacterium]
MAAGDRRPKRAGGLNNLARLLKATNRCSEAEPLCRRALAIYEASFGPDHPSSRSVRANLEVLQREMQNGAGD